MEILEVIPWIVGAIAAVITVFRKNDAAFWYFFISFQLSVFIYFAYASVFDGIIVSDVLSILPFHLAFLMLLCFVYAAKLMFNYKSYVETMESAAAILILSVGSLSFFIGAALLGYHWLQYLVSVMTLVVLLSIYLTKKYTGPLVVEIMTGLTISLAFIFYCVEAKYVFGEISPRSIIDSVTRNAAFAMLAIVYLLYALANRNILEEKNWNRLAGLYISIFILGFTTHHPEVKTL